MTKTIFTAAFLFATTALHAQQSYVVNAAKLNNNHSKVAPPAVSPSMELLAKKNPKAFVDFTTKYGVATDADILADVDKTVVIFIIDNVLTRVFYTPTGLCTGTIRYYDAATLPADVAHIIHSSFGGYTAFGVTELNNTEKTVFLVKIENDKYWKTIQVIDGETLVTEQFKKVK